MTANNLPSFLIMNCLKMFDFVLPFDFNTYSFSKPQYLITQPFIFYIAPLNVSFILNSLTIPQAVYSGFCIPEGCHLHLVTQLALHSEKRLTC